MGAEVVRPSNGVDVELMLSLVDAVVEVVLLSTAAVLLLVVLGGVVEESVDDKDGLVLVEVDCMGTVVKETGNNEVVLPSACVEDVVLFIVEGAGEVEIVVDAVLTSTGVDILLFVVLGCVVLYIVDDEVVLISACVEVVLLLVVLLSAGVDVLMLV